MTVLSLIASSLRLIGAIASGEAPSASEASDSLAVLQDMLEAWGVEGFLAYNTSRESFTLTGGKATYTFGTGGDFDSARPLRVEKITAGSYEMPVRMISTQDEWSRVIPKDAPGTLPLYAYLEGTFPLETVNVWPVPSSSDTLTIYSQKPIAPFVATSDTISLPPGYSKALKYNLAVELCPEFGKQLDPVVAKIANDTKSDLKRKNMKPSLMQSDVSGLGSKRSFNIITGE